MWPNESRAAEELCPSKCPPYSWGIVPKQVGPVHPRNCLEQVSPVHAKYYPDQMSPMHPKYCPEQVSPVHPSECTEQVSLMHLRGYQRGQVACSYPALAQPLGG